MFDARSVSALAVALCLLVPFPARGGEWRCSARGGREWREVRSEHFRLLTDASSGTARDLVGEFEFLHLAVRSALFRTPPPLPGIVQVIAFKDEDHYRAFAPGKADAYYTQVDGDPTVVMTTTFGPYTRLIVAHELTHHLLARVFARQPLWFSEGLASFLETVGVGTSDDDDFLSRSYIAAGTFVVGAVPRHRYVQIRPWRGGLQAVLTAKGALPDELSYGLAWALVFYLVQTHPKEFGDLQGRFARGQDPARAWLEVFPQWDPASDHGMKALDDEVGKYLGSGRFATRALELPKFAGEVRERVAGAGDVHALRLLLPRFEGGASPSFATERAEALAEDPNHVVALRSLAAEKPGEARALSERAAAAHPDDPAAWRFVAENAPDPAAAEAAYRKALELAPDHQATLNDLAWFLVKAEREGEALPLARKAAAIAPWSAPTLDTYAAALQGLGQCGEALPLQRKAVDVLPERMSAGGRKPYLERLAKLEETCGARKPPAAAAAATPPAAAPTAPSATAAPAPSAGPAPAP